MSEGEAPRKDGFFRNVWERWIKNNLMLKVISIVFAILLWSIVIVNDNTERFKTINNVQWLPTGQAEMQNGKRLIAKNLADLRAAIPTVSVRVRAYQGDIAYVTADKIEVTLDLSEVDSKGKQEFWLKARYTGSGKVEEIIPKKLEVDIDTYETRQFPIQVEKINEPPDGIWLLREGTVTTKTILGASTSYVRVSGPSSELDNIVAAAAVYDLSTVKAGTNVNDQTLSYRYIDSHGNTLDSTNLTSDAGNVIIASVSAYAIKTVPIDVDKATIGDPDPDFYVSRVEALPAEVEIAHSDEQLRTVEKLLVEAVDVTGWTESKQETAKILLPTSSWPFVSSEQVQLNITLQKRIVTRMFTNIPVEAINKNEGDRVSIQPVNVVVEGRKSQVEALKDDDIRATLDCSKLTPGTHQTGDIAIELPPDIDPDTKTSISPDKTEVRIN